MELPIFEIAIAATIVAAIAVYWFFIRKGDIIVTGLIYYPIKSCGPLELETAVLDELGIVLDRRWCVIGPDGKFLTAREIPKMITIRPSFNNKKQLCLSATGRPSIVVPDAHQGKIPVQVWNDNFQAGILDYKEVSNWLTEYLGQPCRLAKILPKEEHKRPIAPHYDKVPHEESIQVAFSDAFPFLLVSEESVSALQTICPEKISQANFRPNIIVRGCTPYEEETWSRIQIGDVVLSMAKHCTRCVLTTVDPELGVKSKSGEPLRTLKRERLVTRSGFSFKSKGSCFFGVNLTHIAARGKFSLGDKVKVLAWRPKERDAEADN